jgi:molybdopterin converting factor subunit 1
MQLTVLAFGIARDIVGQFDLPIEVAEATTVAELKQQLTQTYPEFQKLASLRLAVNAEYADDSTILHSNDEIVLIPPVSGG